MFFTRHQFPQAGQTVKDFPSKKLKLVIAKDFCAEKEDPAFSWLLVFRLIEEGAVRAAHFLGTEPDTAATKSASVKFWLLYIFFHSLFDPDQLVLLVKCSRRMAIGVLTGVSELSWQM